MTFKHDSFTLATGTTVYANCGILGLGADCVKLSYGYDGSDTGKEDYTAEERCEIADEMIRRWTEWAA